MSDFEKDLLYFASPALLGQKAGKICFPFSINCLTDYRKEIDRYKKELAPWAFPLNIFTAKNSGYIFLFTARI